MIGEIDGIKIIATPEQYKKYKKSLEEQLEEKDKEIERLNNIINELEKYLIEQAGKSYSNDYDNVLDKLDELKGSDSNE